MKGVHEQFPRVRISKEPFDLWVYEKGIVSRGLVMLALFLTFWFVELVVFPVVQPGRLLPWVLAFFCAAPFLMLAIGRLTPKGKVFFSWRPDWRATSRFRGWFRTQYGTGFVILMFVSFFLGNYFLMVGFAVMVPIFILYTWLLEAEVSITRKGVATRSGVLTWDAISEARIFSKGKVLVLTVSSFGRHLIPYAIYDIPDPEKVEKALRDAISKGQGPKGRKTDDKKV
jgi:hypothetical protein